MNDELKAIIIMIAGIISFICLLCLGSYLIDKKTCYTRYKNFKPEYVGIITGCMIENNGKTIPIESLRITE